MTNKLPALTNLVPGANLEAYIAHAHSIAILSIEEEKKLAERYYYQQDLDAARQLVLAHLRFVIHIARSYSGYGLNQADLIQEGNVGLMKAVKRFNPEVGVRLVSFAVHWIKAEIHEFILKNWRIVKVATTKAQRKLFFNLRSSKKQLGWLSPDEAKDIANDLGVETKTVYEMEGRMSNYDMGFDAGVNDDDEEAYQAPANYIEDHRYEPSARIEEDNFEQNNQDRLQKALTTLDERSRAILQQRWLQDEKATLHQLADIYNVSAERVRQLEKNAMKKLKEAMGGDRLLA